MTNLEFHFKVSEKVWGAGAPMSQSQFRATMEHLMEEYFETDNLYKSIDDWLAAWTVWLQSERADESVQS